MTEDAKLIETVAAFLSENYRNTTHYPRVESTTLFNILRAEGWGPIADARREALEEAVASCFKEALACLDDIVDVDEIGKRECNARAGALMTAALDIRALITA